MVEQMQVRAADRAARDLDDRVAIVFDLWVGDSIAAYIRSTVPHQCFHTALHETAMPSYAAQIITIGTADLMEATRSSGRGSAALAEINSSYHRLKVIFI